MTLARQSATRFAIVSAAVCASLTLSLTSPALGAGPEPSSAAATATAQVDWTGKWIGRTNPASTPPNGQQNAAPLLRKEFSLDSRVAKAQLSVVGLGFYEAWVNGQPVSDGLLDPPPSQFNKTAFSRTFDVTKSVQKGGNVLAFELGRGYFGMADVGGSDFNYPHAPWWSEPRLLAQLDLTLKDGTTQRIVSDGTWKIADSPTHDSLYTGETYDARLALKNWNQVQFNDDAWPAAPEQTAPTQNIVPATTPPVKVTDTIRPAKTTTLANGDTLYDFGRVTAGWARIDAVGSPGTTVKMTYGEQLNADGTVFQFQADQDPSRHVDSYILSGNGRETWEPSFTRHGFRYIQVSASTPLKSFKIEGRIAHSAVTNDGTFTSSNQLLNKIHDNQRASLQDNLWGIPSDTPWRDRQGWTADAFLMLDSAALNFDVSELYDDWLQTFRDTQLPDGSLPVIAPYPQNLALFNDPSWSGTIVLDVWDLYQHYGDESFLTENYDAMTRWMNLMATKVGGTGNIFSSFSFGDWSPPGSERLGTAVFAPEASNLTATADLYHEARTLAGIATQLGHPDDASRYNTFADNIKTAFNSKFFDSAANIYQTTGNPFTGGGNPGYRQTSNLVALAYGLVPEDRTDAVVANLVADIQQRGNNLNTGSIGTKLLLPVLTDHGHGQLAYDIATQTDYPSWGYWVEQGATTSWETWSITDKNQSMNHAFLGTVDDWFYQHLAGIRPAAPGYSRILIEPVIPQGLNQASATVTTPSGKVSVEWKRKGNNRITVTVKAPKGVPTEVRVPILDANPNARSGDSGAGYRTYNVDGGSHTFES